MEQKRLHSGAGAGVRTIGMAQLALDSGRSAGYTAADLALVSRWPGQSTPQTSAPVSETRWLGLPWRMGNPEGPFTR